MTRELFLKKLESVVECTPGAMIPSAALENLGWDSMAELSFIALADSNLGVTVSAHQLSRCRTVSDLIALVDGSFSS